MGFARQAPSEVVAITAATARVEHDDPARPFIGNTIRTSVPSQDTIDLQLILVAQKLHCEEE